MTEMTAYSNSYIWYMDQRVYINLNIHKPLNIQQKTDMSMHLTRVCLSTQSLLLSSPVAPVVGLQMGAAGATAGSKQQEFLLQDFMTVLENSWRIYQGSVWDRQHLLSHPT